MMKSWNVRSFDRLGHIREKSHKFWYFILVQSYVDYMGFYQRHVVPRLVDLTCRTAEIGSWRDRTCAGLVGTVVEVGFGGGLNVAHYPSDVQLVYAIEPSATATKIAARRIHQSHVPVRAIGLDGQLIPLAGESCDSALVTFTLCTIPDPMRAIQEIFRVLKPGGQLHLLEHGISPNPSVARWQRRLDPLEQRIADGCHLTRDPKQLIRESPFESVALQQSFASGPKPWTYFTLALVRKPLTSPTP